MKAFSAVGALSFFRRNSSLLLASRLRVDGVFFFFWSVETSFPLVSTEKEKLGPMLKEKGSLNFEDDEIKSQSLSD